jgi:hypothetical protein
MKQRFDKDGELVHTGASKPSGVMPETMHVRGRRERKLEESSR